MCIYWFKFDAKSKHTHFEDKSASNLFVRTSCKLCQPGYIVICILISESNFRLGPNLFAAKLWHPPTFASLLKVHWWLAGCYSCLDYLLIELWTIFWKARMLRRGSQVAIREACKQTAGAGQVNLFSRSCAFGIKPPGLKRKLHGVFLAGTPLKS